MLANLPDYDYHYYYDYQHVGPCTHVYAMHGNNVRNLAQRPHDQNDYERLQIYYLMLIVIAVVVL